MIVAILVIEIEALSKVLGEKSGTLAARMFAGINEGVAMMKAREDRQSSPARLHPMVPDRPLITTLATPFRPGDLWGHPLTVSLLRRAPVYHIDLPVSRTGVVCSNS